MHFYYFFLLCLPASNIRTAAATARIITVVLKFFDLFIKFTFKVFDYFKRFRASPAVNGLKLIAAKHNVRAVEKVLHYLVLEKACILHFVHDNQLIGWFIATDQYSYETDGLNVKDEQKVLKLKKTLAFIRENFDKEITLDEIAAAGKVCRNKCCQIFRRYLNQSPIDYYNIVYKELSVSQITGGKYTR